MQDTCRRSPRSLLISVYDAQGLCRLGNAWNRVARFHYISGQVDFDAQLFAFGHLAQRWRASEVRGCVQNLHEPPQRVKRVPAQDRDALSGNVNLLDLKFAYAIGIEGHAEPRAVR